MKKITLLLTVLFALTFSWQTNAQLTEGFESGLVSLTNDAGNGVDWAISTSYFSEGAQSAHNAYASGNNNSLVTGALDISGLTVPRLTFDHIAKTEGGWDFCYVEVSTDGTNWTTVGTYDEDSYPEWGTTSSIPVNDWWQSEIIDLSSYISATTYIRFRLESDSSVDRYGWILDNVVVEESPTDTADWNNLQWPPTGAITTGDAHDVYAQVYEAGLTDVTSGQAPGIEAWIGTSTADTDPSTGGWTWAIATFNAEVGNNDEYMLDIGSGLAAGTYYYASRFRLNGGPFTYGGTGGFWANDSGVLTVTDPPPPANDDCANATPYTNDFTMFTEGNCVGTPNILDLSAATDDIGNDDPSCDTFSPNNGVWFTWTATSTGLTFTSGTGLPGLAVYEAGTCGTLVEVGCLNNASGSITGLTVSNNYILFIWDDTAGTTVDFCLEEFTAPPPPANDDCTGAIALTVNADLACGVVTPGTIAAATDSGVNNCGGTEDDDVWYSFVATSTSHVVDIINITGGTTDLYHAVYDATPGCGALAAALTCSDPNTSTTSGLTIGVTYYVQVYSWTATSGQTSTFDICVGTPPPPPPNDDCANATGVTSLPYNEVVDASGATNNAGFVSCDGSAVMNDGVWYTFTTINGGTVDIAITGVTGWDPEVRLFSGSCGTFTCVANADSGGTGGSETITGATVAAGTQYWINVGYWSGSTDSSEGPFTIDISTSDTTTLPVSEYVFENFKYFPNPVNDNLNLRAQSNIQNVSIYNMLGQEVSRISPNAISSDVDMSALQTGVYFVNVTINDTTETIRIVKQ